MAVMGRPPKLTPELIEKAKGYIATCVDDLENKKVHLPTIEGFAIYLDVSRDTLYAWEKENEDFSYILEGVRKEQSRRIINNGMAGTYNSTIAKLILHKHGYHEKQEVEHSGNLNINLVKYADTDPTS